MTSRSDVTAGEIISWGLLKATKTGILLTLFMPLVVTASTLFPFIVGKAIYSRSIIELTVALWLLLLLVAPEYKPRRSWIMIIFGIWLLCSIISGLAGVSMQRSMWSTYERMQGIVDLAHWATFILVVSSIFRTPNDWKWLFIVNLSVSVLVSILGLGQVLDAFEVNVLENSSSTRLTSTLGNATYVGAYTMINIFITLGVLAFLSRNEQIDRFDQTIQPTRSRMARRRRNRADHRRNTKTRLNRWSFARWVFLIVLLIEFWALWMTGTRGAFIGLAAGAGTFAVVYSVCGEVQYIRKVSYAIMSIMSVFLILFIVAKTTVVLDSVIDRSPTLSRISNIGPNDQNIKGRITSIAAGWQAFQQKPIFGWGPENYLIAWGRYFDAESGVEERFDQAHNKLIEELTTKGIVGLISYLCIWGGMIWVFIRAVNFKDGYEKVVVILVGAALSSFFIQNMSLFDSPATVLQFSVLVSFFVAEEVRQRSTTHERQDGTRLRKQIGNVRGKRSELFTLKAATPINRSICAVVIVLLLTVSLWHWNVKLYTAAAATVQSTNPRITWGQRLGYYQKSFDEFEQLANYSRLLLIRDVSANIHAMSGKEFAHAETLIEKESDRALSSEPENWRIHVALAGFYQSAVYLDNSYVGLARKHVDQANVLAPRTIETRHVRSVQEKIENKIIGP